MFSGKLMKLTTVGAVAAAAIAVGVTASPALAAGYAINSAAGCDAFIAGIGATGYASGNECFVDGGTLPFASTLAINSGWTLTGSFTNNGSITLNGVLHVTSAMTSWGILAMPGSTLLIDAPFASTGGLSTFGSTLIINAPFNDHGATMPNSSTITIAADVSAFYWQLTASTVTIHSGTFTNTGSYFLTLGSTTTLIEAPVCGSFVNEVSTMFFGTIVDDCDPKVEVRRATGQTDPTLTGPVVFDVIFGEDVTGFDINDLQLTTTGTVIAAIQSITGGPAHYVVTVDATGEGDVSLSVLAGAVTDAADNQSAASTSDDNTFTLGEVGELVPTGGDSTLTLPALFALLAGALLVGLGRRRYSTTR